MPVTRIVITSTPARPKPKTGDRRVTKKHGLQIRIPQVCTFGPGAGARIYSNGRPCFEWRKPADLPRIYRHYLTAEERASLPPNAPAAA
jgi:hypothetical protein